GRQSMTQSPGLLSYGAEAPVVQSLPGASTELAPGLSEAMVRFAARYEYARTVEDVLARRTRLLFLDARLAEQLAASVAGILQEGTGADPKLNEFLVIAAHYQHVPA